MTWIIGSTPKGRLSAKLTAGLAISAILVFGAFARPAEARYYNHYYNGGYYRAPPVVYGSSYGNGYYGNSYYPPPVVYGPGIGINLGGIGIGIGIR